MDKNTKKMFFSSVSWQMLNKIFSFGMNFFIQLLLARLVIPEDFGNLAILNAIIGIATIFVESGISIALIQKKELEGQDVFTAQVISIIVALLFCAVLCVAAFPISAYYNAPDLAMPLRVISVILVFNSINSVFSSFLMRNMEFKKLFIRNVITIPISGGIGIVLAYKGFGIWALVIYQITYAALNSVVFIFFSKVKIVFRFSIEKAKQLYSFGIKILLSGLVNSIYDTIRTLVIGGKYSKSDLAFYDRSYTYSRYTVQIVNSTINSVALPLFSRQQDSLENVKKSSRSIVSMSAFIMFPVLIGLAAISRPLILTLLTNKWEACIPFFTVFCFLRIPGVVTNVDMQAFYAIGRSDIALKCSILSLVLNIVSLYFVLPYGVFAIAINALIVEILVSFIIMIISSRIIHYSLIERMKDLCRPIMNCTVLYIVESLIPMVLDRVISYGILLVLQFLMGVLVYCLMAVITRDKNIGAIMGIIRRNK